LKILLTLSLNEGSAFTCSSSSSLSIEARPIVRPAKIPEQNIKATETHASIIYHFSFPLSLGSVRSFNFALTFVTQK
jgi:hypothetical protein